MFDPATTPTSAGGYPWKADGDYSTLAYIKNEIDQRQKYTAHMHYEGGSYTFGIKEIKGHQTVAIDFKRIRNSQTPDVNGNIIPLHVDKGQISWSVIGNGNNKLSGRSEQISVTNGLSSTYDCRNCCPNSYNDSWLVPFDFLAAVGTSETFLAQQQDVNCYGQVYPPYPGGVVSWNSTFPDVASVNFGGEARAWSMGTSMIQASWPADSWFEGLNELCEYTPVTVMEEAPMEVVQPTVASLAASIASTKNPTATLTPLPGTFLTTNTSTTFPTESTTDVMVVFQSSSESVTVSGQGVNPSNAGSQIKWRIDRNPGDTVATGTPTLSAQTGAQIILTPTTAGSFRLICYVDTNGNGSYDSGEEVRVLLLAIIRVGISSDCTIDSPMANFQGDVPNTTEFGVRSGALPMSMRCDFVIEGGGSSAKIGTNKVYFGNVGNLIGDTARVTYVTSGSATENPGASLPMVDTGRVKQGNAPTGGETAFREDSLVPGMDDSSEDRPPPSVPHHYRCDGGHVWGEG